MWSILLFPCSSFAETVIVWLPSENTGLIGMFQFQLLFTLPVKSWVPLKIPITAQDSLVPEIFVNDWFKYAQSVGKTVKEVL